MLQSDHEKYIRRAKEVQAAAKEDAPSTSAEAATLYKKQDLSLKEGETIKCASEGPIDNTAVKLG